MSWALDQDWTLLKRARDLSRAYEIGLREAPAAIYAETSYHVEEFLAGLLPALLQLCIVQALATAIGAGIGAGLGALVFGAGAIPGAAVGAEAGFDLGLTILGWLGLAFLAAAIAHSLGDVVTLLKHAVVQAWRAADAHEDERRQQVRQAGQTLARAMAVLVRLILQGIVAWLLKRGIDKAPELIAELKASRLGVAFGEWVEKNLGRLVNDPKLRPHAGEGSTTKVATESTAQTPSQLAKKPPADEPATNTKSIKDASNAEKGVFGEAKADEFMQSQGFEKMNGNGKPVQVGDPPKGKGIDGVWRNKNFPPPPEYVVTEAKYGSGQLGTLKDGTKQMSDKWVSNRLSKEVGPSAADDIELSGYDKWLLRVDENGAVTRTTLP